MTDIILYARVSTKSFDQLTSLQNQTSTLSDYAKVNSYNTTMLSETVSVSNGMTKKLKSLIIEKFEKLNKKVTLIVTAIDRITRNVTDIQFIKSHVQTIIMIRGDLVVFDTKKDWRTILNLIADATEEIDVIKDRAIASNNLKRKRSVRELCLNAELRSVNVKTLLHDLASGIDEKINIAIDNIATMIQKAQSLQTQQDWEAISTVSDMYSGFLFTDLYKTYNYENIPTHIKKNELKDYVQQMFSNLSFDVDQHILSEFINANINFGKKKYLMNTNVVAPDDNELLEITNTLLKISLNKNTKKLLSTTEIKQIENISKKIQHSMQNISCDSNDDSDDDSEYIKKMTKQKNL